MEMQNCPLHSPRRQPEVAAAGFPRHLQADQENMQTTIYAAEWCISQLVFPALQQWGKQGD